MKAKIAGVALAALIGACAPGSAAQARTLQIQSVYDLYTDSGSLHYKSLFDPQSGNYTYSSLTSDIGLPIVDGGFSLEITPTVDGLSKLEISFSGVGANHTYCEQGACGPEFNVAMGSFEILTNKQLSYTQSFSLSGSDIVSSSANGIAYLGGFDPVVVPVGPFDPALSFSLDISTVPLPSSAPLFGLALIGLGAATYGARRYRAV